MKRKYPWGAQRGIKEYGDYGVMVTLELVELSSRVRFPIVAQTSRPECECIPAVAVWSDYRESEDGGREANRLKGD